MNRLESIYFELEKAENELKAIETMTEGEVCDMYNVDCRKEAIQLLNEELIALQSDLEKEINRLESWD